MIDLARARAETPGCEQVAHFNNAGAALMPQPVIDAMTGYIATEARLGGYEAAEARAAELEHAYDSAAQLLGARRDEIAILDSNTRAWDAVFYGMTFIAGDRILTSTAEYASNYLAFLQVARRTGVEVEAVPNDESGQMSVDHLRDMLDSSVKLIAVTHVPTSSGLVNPAEEVGTLARAAGIPYLLDACQSAGQIDLDVTRIGCDFLSSTGRKYLRAPRGTGILFVRRDRIKGLEPAILDFHSATWIAPDRYEVRDDARRFEIFEMNQAAKLGLGVAIDYALGWGLPAIETRVTALAENLRALLAAVPGVTVRDPGRQRCGIVTFTVDGTTPTEVRRRLTEERINVWVSVAASSLLDMRSRGVDELVRASVHYYNSEEELDRLVAAVARIRALRGRGNNL